MALDRNALQDSQYRTSHKFRITPMKSVENCSSKGFDRVCLRLRPCVENVFLVHLICQVVIGNSSKIQQQMPVYHRILYYQPHYPIMYK